MASSGHAQVKGNSTPAVNFNTANIAGGARVTNVNGDYTVNTGDHINNIHNAITQGSPFSGLVVSDAAYNSGGGARVGCHKGTRQASIEAFFSWLRDGKTAICWLSGPAGYGKSAILQSIAERCAIEHILAASFFFLRGVGARSGFYLFIITLAYQLSLSFPSTKSAIEDALRADITLPSQSIKHQLEKLIIGPLAAARLSTTPIVFLVDALDECNDVKNTKEFIRILADVFASRQIQVRWLLSSRREEHIRKAFSDEVVSEATTRFALEDFNATLDIEKFLTDHFATICREDTDLMRNIPIPWPSIKDTRALVEKADGMFNFAFTLVKFITDGSAHPDQKLQVVLKLHAGLDPLYAQVLGAVPKNIACFRMVLTTLMIVREQPSINVLADLLELPAGNVLHALTSIQSIIHVPADDTTPIQLNHTSLRDFLTDKKRSKDLFIDPPAAHFTLAANCLMLMNRTFHRDVFPDLNAGSLYASEYWVEHLKDGAVDTEASPEHVLILGNFLSSEVMEVWINGLILQGEMTRTQWRLVALIKTCKLLKKGGLLDIAAKIKERVEMVRNFATFKAEYPLTRGVLRADGRVLTDLRRALCRRSIARRNETWPQRRIRLARKALGLQILNSSQYQLKKQAGRKEGWIGILIETKRMRGADRVSRSSWRCVGVAGDRLAGRGRNWSYGFWCGWEQESGRIGE
ncbi:hypothetical protein FIBSPDRAFT_877067 [Athelia psychrophila]|uniref:NACHT domain-containing protein n=1 Tax=Athelia psychrophila TaxID=1759441 RepID=A0A167W9R6_9AGAM|nr:hypothetical protein FIBSPDRAFT_877067 [Fibularhizoctonia sp. CBS 109695]